MDGNLFSEYFVKLGFEVNQPEAEKFKRSLAEAAAAAERHTSGIIGQLIKWQAAITGAFGAIGLSTVSMMDKVADADLAYQKIGQRMGITTKAARELTIAQKVLNITLADAAWNMEDRMRLRTMVQGFEQKYLEPSLPANFERNMLAIRDIARQFQYIEGTMVYLAMNVSSKLYDALGGDAFFQKVQAFSLWFAQHSKEISDWLTRVLAPILKDTWHIMEDLWKVAEKLAEAFVRIVGAISGDDSLRSGAVNMDTLGKAIDKAAGYMVQFVDAMTSAEMVMLDMVETLADLVRGFMDLAQMKFSQAGKDFSRAGHDMGSAGSDLTPGGAGVLITGGLGALLGIRTIGGLVRGIGGVVRSGAGGVAEGAAAEMAAGGAGAAAAGAAAKGATGAFGMSALGSWLSIFGLANIAQHFAEQDRANGMLDPSTFAGRELAWENRNPVLRWLNGLVGGGNGSSGPVDINKLVSAVAWAESGGHQIDPKTGRVVLGPVTRSGERAIGMMQLMPETARALGVNPYDANENLAGGKAYMTQLLAKYHNNVQEALAAYNWGPDSLDRAMKRHGGQFAMDYLPGATRDYINRIEGHLDGKPNVTINVGGITATGTNLTSDQLTDATYKGVDKALREQNQRQLINAQAAGVW